MSYVELKSVRKRFGDTEIIHGIDLGIEKEEFTVFVGPSGCGKSTLLRMIAGLEDLQDGSIHIGGTRVDQLQPAERGIAMVFQNYALYPHMTVFENMAFGLKIAKTAAADIRAKVERAASILQIAEILQRRPRELSGGQRQRVAIGRAIVREPKVFLFDEPLSNLDAKLRVQMRLELTRLRRQLRATMIYVTHDQVEAMTMADRIVVLNQGRVEQAGRPLDLYHAPRNRFVAGFIGSPAMNFLEGTVTAAARTQRHHRAPRRRDDHGSAQARCGEAGRCRGARRPAGGTGREGQGRRRAGGPRGGGGASRQRDLRLSRSSGQQRFRCPCRGRRCGPAGRSHAHRHSRQRLPRVRRDGDRPSTRRDGSLSGR